MSKKNLSLWMNGFIGEANPIDQAKELPQEQQVEQTQELLKTEHTHPIRTV